MRCLIVDDSSVIRKVTRRILERMGMKDGEAFILSQSNDPEPSPADDSADRRTQET